MCSASEAELATECERLQRQLHAVMEVRAAEINADNLRLVNYLTEVHSHLSGTCRMITTQIIVSAGHNLLWPMSGICMGLERLTTIYVCKPWRFAIAPLQQVQDESHACLPPRLLKRGMYVQENLKLEQENQRVILLLASNAKSENRGLLKDILSNVERLQREKAKVSHSTPHA